MRINPIIQITFIILSLSIFLSCEKEKEALVIAITSPTNNSEIEHFTTVPIVYESNSKFAIDYFIDDNLIHASSSPSSIYKWLTTNFSIGKHTLKVVVKEEDGRTASDQIEINITKSKSLETGTIADIDGNEYNTVKIGTQWWMAENLRTTKYNDGTAIFNEKDNWAWSFLEKGGYCFFDNDFETNAKQHGALYNQYAVATDKLCPAGWHVPSKGELDQLIAYLGPVDQIGKKIKAPCIWEWNTFDGNGTNETGFSALPGGFRSDDEEGFLGKYEHTIWWLYEDAINSDFYNTWSVESRSQKLIRYQYSSGYGCSVRCIKYVQ